MEINTTKIMQLGNLASDTDRFKNRTIGRVYSPSGICPTLNTNGGGQREPRIVIKRKIELCQKQ